MSNPWICVPVGILLLVVSFISFSEYKGKQQVNERISSHVQNATVASDPREVAVEIAQAVDLIALNRDPIQDPDAFSTMIAKIDKSRSLADENEFEAALSQIQENLAQMDAWWHESLLGSLSLGIFSFALGMFLVLDPIIRPRLVGVRERLHKEQMI